MFLADIYFPVMCYIPICFQFVFMLCVCGKEGYQLKKSILIENLFICVVVIDCYVDLACRKVFFPLVCFCLLFPQFLSHHTVATGQVSWRILGSVGHKSNFCKP